MNNFGINIKLNNIDASSGSFRIALDCCNAKDINVINQCVISRFPEGRVTSSGTLGGGRYQVNVKILENSIASYQGLSARDFEDKVMNSLGGIDIDISLGGCS